MRLHGLFVSCKTCARCFWGQMPNFNPVQWRGTFVGRFERFARPARYLFFRVLWRWKKNTSMIEREYSKTKKNHQKLITKRKHKAPYLAKYTKIGKVIKCFRTAAFTDLDQWHFVLKLSGHVSFIILNLCTKKEEQLTKMRSDILSENKCTQKVAERLTLNLWPKVRYVAPAFYLLFEYEVRSLYIENIHSYCTRNNGLFINHNDLDLQTGDLKLYVCLPVVM